MRLIERWNAMSPAECAAYSDDVDAMFARWYLAESRGDAEFQRFLHAAADR